MSAGAPAKASIVIGGTTNELEAAVDRAASKLKGLAVTAVGIFAGAATFSWGYDLMKQSDQAEIAFTKLLGSADSAKATLAAIADFAAKTPMDNPSLVKAYQQLLAFKFAAQDIPGILRVLGDTASAMPGEMGENVSKLAVIMGQMRSKAKLSAGEMLQLTEAGINAWEYLRQGMNLSTVAEVVAKSEAGAIDAATAVRMVLAGMEKDYNGLMETRSKTVEGLVSTITDNLGRGLTAVFKGATGGDFKTWLEDFGNGLNELGSTGETVGARIAAGLQVVKNVFDGLYAVGQAISDVLQAAFESAGIKDFSGELSNVRTDFDLVKNIAMSFIQGFSIGLAFIGDAINNYVVGPIKVIGGLMVQFVSRVLEATAALLDGLGYISDTAKQMAEDLHGVASRVNGFGEQLQAGGAKDINSEMVATARVKEFFKKLETAPAAKAPSGPGPLSQMFKSLTDTAINFQKPVKDMTSLIADANAQMAAELKKREELSRQEAQKRADKIADDARSAGEKFRDKLNEIANTPGLSKDQKNFAINDAFKELVGSLPGYSPNGAMMAGSAEAQRTIAEARFGGGNKVEDILKRVELEAKASRKANEEVVKALEKAKVLPIGI